jgi:Pirin C-terminal cupin domain
VLSGSASFGSSSAIDKFNCVVLTAGANETGVEIIAEQDGTEMVLISGEPLDQKIVRKSTRFSSFISVPLGMADDRMKWCRVWTICNDGHEGYPASLHGLYGVFSYNFEN